MIDSNKILEYFNNNKHKSLINSKLTMIQKLSHEDYKYVLWMFPYPSGKLHIGHIWNATLSDAICIYYKIFEQKHIFQPIGWDSFGLPAENKAIQENIHPKIWTEKNINIMRKKLIDFGFSLNFDSEIDTSKIDYYKFDQEIFRSMFEHNLIYRKHKKLFFCMFCNVILAREQVINRTYCWRCNNKIQYKTVWQWFIKINHFWKELNNFKDHEQWEPNIINSQKKWIEKRTLYYVEDHNKIFFIEPKILEQKKYGFKSITNNSKHVKYKVFNKIQTELHSELLKKQTEFNAIVLDKNLKYSHKIFTILQNNIKQKIVNKLQDWNISRQRYWGTPIPLINCKKCGWVSDKNIVKLPSKFINLSRDKKFLTTVCPECKHTAYRSDETLDTFFSSSWYMFRYLYANDKNHKFGKNFKNIDVYIGGKEHNTSHILFTRFFYYFFKNNQDINNSKNIHINCLINQGLILGKTQFCKHCNKYINTNNSMCLNKQHKVMTTIEKISKSKLNSIDFDFITREFCPDIIKFTLLFAAPISQDRLFNIDNLYTQKKFYEKLIKLWNEYINTNKKSCITSNDMFKDYYNIFILLLEAKHDIRQFKFNVAIAKIFKIYKLTRNNKILWWSKTFLAMFFTIMRPIIPCLSFYVLDKLNINTNDMIKYFNNFSKYSVSFKPDDRDYVYIWLPSKYTVQIIHSVLKLKDKYIISGTKGHQIYLQLQKK